MRRFILRLVIVILLLGGIVIYGDNGATSASICPITLGSIAIERGTISYQQLGTGEPILLLHGLFASKEQWDSMMCVLSNAGYQAIAPDLPGYGDSTGFTVSDYALENQVAVLHQFVDQLEIESFHIAGSSMGGAIATLYSQLYPDQVRSLALIGAPLGVAEWANGVKESIIKGINPFIPITKAQFDLEMSLLFVAPPAIPEQVKTEKINDYVTRNQHYQQVWNIVNLYNDVLCQTSCLSPPTLAIWGEEDQIYDIHSIDRLQRCIAGSQVIQLPRAGHLLLMENAQQVGSDYLSFLKAINPSLAEAALVTVD